MSIKRYDSDTKELNDVAGVYRLQGGGATIEVDDELSNLSENPVKNKVITGELNKKLTEVSVMPQNPTDKQTVLFVGETTGDFVKGTIYEYSESESKWNPISTAEIDVDDSLDSTSENPLKNKVIVSALGAKQPIQLVSAMVLESNPYTTVPTALSALATRLGDTYTKNETDLKTAGLMNPKGTVTFVNLPTLADAEVGDMYNVSDEFTTTSDFEEGAGELIPAGANVYKTSGEKWDVLAGSPVTGVKGDKEANYRRGNVNITPANIGAYTSGQVDALLSGKQNIILSNPMMLESASYTQVPTALGALATRLEDTYKKNEIDHKVHSSYTKAEWEALSDSERKSLVGKMIVISDDEETGQTGGGGGIGDVHIVVGEKYEVAEYVEAEYDSYYLFTTVYTESYFEGAIIMAGNTNNVYSKNGIGRGGAILQAKSDTVKYHRSGSLENSKLCKFDFYDSNNNKVNDKVSLLGPHDWTKYSEGEITVSMKKLYLIAISDYTSETILEGCDIVCNTALPENESYTQTMMMLVIARSEKIVCSNAIYVIPLVAATTSETIDF